MTHQLKAILKFTDEGDQKGKKRQSNEYIVVPTYIPTALQKIKVASVAYSSLYVINRMARN
ncbi:receptor like protein 23 [Perilla frutescens var. frutescens]|nr:receptor like protein 23 [Perilla frutescens var. frutescens]